MSSIIADYEEALRRIRVSRITSKQMTRRSDVERIIFSHGQEEEYPLDEIYGAFLNSTAEEIRTVRRKLEKQKWHLMDEEEREEFLLNYLPYDRHYYLDFFGDFRNFEFRILIDVVFDYNYMYAYEEQKKTPSEPIRTANLLMKS